MSEAAYRIESVASELFKRIDTSYLIRALANDTTHAGISTFDLSVGIDTSNDGSKHDRAVKVIKHVFEQPDTDALIIEMLDVLYLQNPYAMRDDNETYQQLHSKVLVPRGITLGDDGFTLPDGRGLDQLERVTGAVEPTPKPTPAFPDVWPSAEFTPWSSAEHSKPKVEPAPATEPKRALNKVFVVHGRDPRPVDTLKQYLLFLGLHMMPWSEAVSLTGKPQPHTYDVVQAGMENAAAIIVIFSPDDLARIKDDFSESGDPDRTPQGQARQNVTLEAGMAFAMAPERTIFLKSANTREISDIDGFNWVKMNGTWDSRMDLKNRLTNAGATVSSGNQNLMDTLAGPFKVE